MIEYRDVWKAFDHPVLSGVSLTVHEGEMFALFGPSGTGKSVLLKTTIDLITPDRGDVLIEGTSVYASRQALAEAREKVGYVFQHAALFDSLNVYDNVSLGIPEKTVNADRREVTARKVWRALELVNLDPKIVLSKLPSELSGGMRKRVGIARAIVGRPRILLWDEPTTGLDPVNTAAVELLIVRLSGELDVTSLVVTHDIEGGLDICDRVAMLDSGRLRFCGSPEAFRGSSDTLVQAFVDRAAAERALDLSDAPS
ncbi:MAG: ATP-binding cassette domain-containing protein [Longimicrobiales bacterium]|nr:ATP-binding cassette domain-containing protein [Longimicrobiales bacterium]